MINQGSDYQHKVARNTGKAKGEKGAGRGQHAAAESA